MELACKENIANFWGGVNLLKSSGFFKYQQV